VDTARSHSQNAPERDPKISAGIAASQAGHVGAALAAFARAQATSPANALIYFLIGSEYAGAGRIEAAESALMTAVVLAPKFQLARYQLGLLQFSSARAALALGTWAPLLEEDAGSYLSSFVRGFAALTSDDFNSSRLHFAQGLSINKDNPAVSEDIRRVLSSFPQANVGEERTSDTESSGHVLVSNYGRYGTLH
jgi:tetratricopeptide (TPR) repeat protein